MSVEREPDVEIEKIPVRSSKSFEVIESAVDSAVTSPNVVCDELKKTRFTGQVVVSFHEGGVRGITTQQKIQKKV